MIHKTDERCFRFLEIVCFSGLVIVGTWLRVKGRAAQPYYLPVLFLTMASTGLVFMARFLIYAHPESLFDRTRAESVDLSAKRKIELSVGCVMCLPMFVLGLIGLLNPVTFEKTITALSPFRFVLAEGGESMTGVVLLMAVAAAVTVVGAVRAILRLFLIGVTLLVIVTFAAVVMFY